MKPSMQWSVVIARVRNGTTTAADADYLEEMRAGMDAGGRGRHEYLRLMRKRAEKRDAAVKLLREQGRYVRCGDKIVGG